MQDLQFCLSNACFRKHADIYFDQIVVYWKKEEQYSTKCATKEEQYYAHTGVIQSKSDTLIHFGTLSFRFDRINSVITCLHA